MMKARTVWRWIAVVAGPAALCQCTALWDLQALQGEPLEDDSGAGSVDGGSAIARPPSEGGTKPATDAGADAGSVHDAGPAPADASPGQTADGPFVQDASPSDAPSSRADARSGDVTDASPDAGSPSPTDAPYDSGPAMGPPDSGASSGNCDLGQPWGAPVEVSSLQSSTREAGLHSFGSQLTAFFWVGPLGATNLYSATRIDTSHPFQNPTLLNNVNGGSGAQYDPSVTGDGLTLFFRSTRVGGPGLDDIYWASRSNLQSDFSNVTLASNLNSSASDVQPYVVPGGTEIYFSSNRTGDYDIYDAAGNGGAFGQPARVAEVSQVGADDQNPTVSADGLEIVFSSSRSGGQGGQDIWMAQRSSTSAPFGAPALVPQVNSGGNDYPSWVSPDLCQLYLYSDRTGPLHIYLATRPP